MTQTVELLQSLKKCLKAKNLTYGDLATALGLSEASIKRLFSEQSFSLKRLEDVCRFLDMSIYDLARMSRTAAEGQTTRLTLKQEQGLAADLPTLAYFYLLLTGRSAEKIAGEFGVSERQQNALLARLKRLKLVELCPDKSVRLMTEMHVNWRRDGPIRKQYQRQLQQSFFNDRFTGTDRSFRFLTGELSKASLAVLERKLERLERDFDELAELDMHRASSKKNACGLMIGFRPWTFWQLLQAEADNMGPIAERSQGK